MSREIRLSWTRPKRGRYGASWIRYDEYQASFEARRGDLDGRRWIAWNVRKLVPDLEPAKNASIELPVGSITTKQWTSLVNAHRKNAEDALISCLGPLSTKDKERFVELDAIEEKRKLTHPEREERKILTLRYQRNT